MSKLNKVIKDLTEQGIDAQLYKYKNGECSCCYGPDWKDKSLPIIVIPLNVAENQGGYIEEYEQGEEEIEIDNPDYDPDDSDSDEEEYIWDYEVVSVENPLWDENSNENFDGDDAVKKVYISYNEGKGFTRKQLGETLNKSLQANGFKTEWNGSENQCVTIIPS